jgi:hypothetical protein
MKKWVLLILAILLVIFGSILLIPSVLYLIRELEGTRFIFDVQSIWAIFISILGVVANFLGIVSFIQLVFKKELPAHH